MAETGGWLTTLYPMKIKQEAISPQGHRRVMAEAAWSVGNLEFYENKVSPQGIVCEDQSLLVTQGGKY